MEFNKNIIENEMRRNVDNTYLSVDVEEKKYKLKTWSFSIEVMRLSTSFSLPLSLD